MYEVVIRAVCFVYSSGSYELAEAANVERGTKVVVHLKDEEQRYADKTVVEG